MPTTTSDRPTSRSSTGFPEVSATAAWLLAVRPRTLVAGVVPVAVGLAYAALDGALDVAVAGVTLATAVLLQVGTNLANDYYDAVAGIDTAERLGPTRVTQAGLIDAPRVHRAMLTVFACALAGGFYLVAVGGWPILAIGLASLAAALAYSAGPWPLAAHGLGDLLAFVFFGNVAVCGTVYLQSFVVPGAALAASVPVACLATALIVVNNLRDIPTDRTTGKRTLAVRIGDRATRVEYVALLATSFLALVGLAVAIKPAVALTLLALPLAAGEARRLWRRRGAELNESLAGTARLYLVVGVLYVAGLLL